MEEKTNLVSDAFKAFMTNAPEHAKAWSELVQALANAAAIDKMDCTPAIGQIST
jgi:hypothetical protein